MLPTSSLSAKTITDVFFKLFASNNAVNLAVKEMFLFTQFKGLTPDGKQFLALQLDLKNVNKDKQQYQIPNMSSHFYINVNNEGMYPASDATWLTETPLANPGDYEVNVFPDKNHSGMLMFLVPEEPITQLSLHYYDTNYGHINIPLIGAMNQELLKLNKLPTTAPVNIADSFTMTVNSVSDVPKLDIYQAPKDSSFRVIEADMKSNVQALLDISPKERLWMKTNTAAGPLLVQMNDVTAYTPFGFTEPVMLGPGSVNKVRMVYPIAKALAGSSSEIFGDLTDGSLNIPVIKGGSYGKKGGKTTAEGSGRRSIRSMPAVILRATREKSAEVLTGSAFFFGEGAGVPARPPKNEATSFIGIADIDEQHWTIGWNFR
jgi:hypothetical protein